MIGLPLAHKTRTAQANSRPTGCPKMTWGRTLKKALQRNSLPQPSFSSGENLLSIEASGGLFMGPNQRNNNSPKRANKAPGTDYGMEMATSEKFTYSQPNRLKPEEQQKISMFMQNAFLLACTVCSLHNAKRI